MFNWITEAKLGKCGENKWSNYSFFSICFEGENQHSHTKIFNLGRKMTTRSVAVHLNFYNKIHKIFLMYHYGLPELLFSWCIQTLLGGCGVWNIPQAESREGELACPRMRRNEEHCWGEIQKKNLEFLLPVHKFLAMIGILRLLLVAFKTLWLNYCLLWE